MNKFDVIEFRKQKALKYEQERLANELEHGSVKRFNNNEFKQSIKMSNNYRKSGTTRRTHSKGNLWNHTNLPKIKSDIDIWYKNI